jgi:hypothetical protein
VQDAVLDQVQPLAVRQLLCAVMLAQVPDGVPEQLPVSLRQLQPLLAGHVVPEVAALQGVAVPEQTPATVVHVHPYSALHAVLVVCEEHAAGVPEQVRVAESQVHPMLAQYVA